MLPSVEMLSFLSSAHTPARYSTLNAPLSTFSITGPQGRGCIFLPSAEMLNLLSTAHTPIFTAQCTFATFSIPRPQGRVRTLFHSVEMINLLSCAQTPIFTGQCASDCIQDNWVSGHRGALCSLLLRCSVFCHVNTHRYSPLTASLSTFSITGPQDRVRALLLSAEMLILLSYAHTPIFTAQCTSVYIQVNWASGQSMYHAPLC